MIRYRLYGYKPLAAFFVLTFLLSWGGILVILAARRFDLAPMQPLEAGLTFLVMLLGPSASGVIVTALRDRGPGFSELGARLIHWRLGARWYAVALLTIPISLLTILWPLSVMVDPVFTPRFQWSLFAVGLLAGTFEEIGWTGFATPRLLARQPLWVAGFRLGLIWAFWHMLVDFRFNIGAMGAIWPLEFAIVSVATLIPYRMLMTWVYSKTHSLLLAMMMHASFTGWLLVLFPATSFAQNLFWQTLFAVMLWILAAAVMRRHAISAARLSILPADQSNASRKEWRPS